MPPLVIVNCVLPDSARPCSRSVLAALVVHLSCLRARPFDVPPNAPPSDTPPSDAPPSDVPPNAAWPFARCLTPQHDATAPPPLNTEHRTLRHRPYGPPPQAPGGRRPPRRSGACRIWCRKGGGDVESRAGGGRVNCFVSFSARRGRGFRPRCHSNTQQMDTLPGQRTISPPPQSWHAVCPHAPIR